ncbi:hypothetical protein [Okeania sp. SIO1I7]|uniref:plasmid mobilization protein n=1 Tax=Okeania sp. SIO1I7 TaxID=2607772 RepID=UPI0013FCD0BB|nr:hypothetical protein [Okeania sp. SIO1I7]NET29963.1 hypothetical protein [Okeania sp. SIO1I7]
MSKNLSPLSSRGKKIKPDQKRTERIYSQLTLEEMAIFEQLCREAGVQKGVYIRAAILSSEKSLSKPVPEINREIWSNLARLSANLNQYQKAINSGIATSYPPGMLESVRELVSQLRADLISD